MFRRPFLFIFKLNANDRSASFPEMPVELPGDFAVKDFYPGRVVRIVGNGGT